MLYWLAMNRKQKRILGLLALANIIVIGLLAGYVIITTLQDRPAAPPSPTVTRDAVGTPAGIPGGIPTGDLPPCTRYLMETWTLPGQSVQVRRDQAHAWVDLTLTSGADETPTPQLLWLTLDLLTQDLIDVCPDLSTLTLTVSIAEDDRIQHYVAEIEGAALSAWLRDESKDDEFATTVRYRTAQTTP